MLGRKKKFQRQGLLEVKSRAQPLKALRVRMAITALVISASVVLALLVVWKGGQWVLDRFVVTNPAFAVHQILISTDGIIPAGQIREWSNVKIGQNLFALDLARIKRDLELVPWIEAASVERILPNQLIIRVREREPIARIVMFTQRSGDGLLEPAALFLDEHGMTLSPMLRALNAAAFDSATRSLPTITGIPTASFRPGHPVQSPRVLAALQWIRAFLSSEMAGRVDILAIDVSSASSLLVTTEQGNEISFGCQAFEPQLARWRKIHDFGAERGKVLRSLDLAVGNYVPAVWLDLTNAPPQTTRPRETSPYRKRHV